MPIDETPENVEMVQRSVYMTAPQWEWLDMQARRAQTRSASAEIRRLVERERQRERAESALAA